MTNTQLAEQLVGQPADVQAEIIRINTEVRPIALQVALLVPLDRRTHRPVRLVPDDAPAGHRPIGRRGGRGVRLTWPVTGRQPRTLRR